MYAIYTKNVDYYGEEDKNIFAICESKDLAEEYVKEFNRNEIFVYEDYDDGYPYGDKKLSIETTYVEEIKDIDVLLTNLLLFIITERTKHISPFMPIMFSGNGKIDVEATISDYEKIHSKFEKEKALYLNLQ